MEVLRVAENVGFLKSPARWVFWIFICSGVSALEVTFFFLSVHLSAGLLKLNEHISVKLCEGIVQGTRRN